MRGGGSRGPDRPGARRGPLAPGPPGPSASAPHADSARRERPAPPAAPGLETLAAASFVGHGVAMSPESDGGRTPRGALVEFVRLIMVVLLAIAGFEIARRVNGKTGTAVLGIVLGSASGYVLGGVLGRQTAVAVSSVEREFRRISAAEIAAGVAGIVIALLIALLASIPLFHLPNDAAWPAVAFVYVTLTY